MNAPHNPSRSSGARRAWAQPRFLLGAAALTLAGATWASFAAPAPATKPAVAMPHTSSKSSDKPVSLSDLPGMVARYGQARGAAASSGGRTLRAVGTGVSGFNLVETDLTPNSPSDEREPVVSPTGDFIAFTSTGADTDNNGTLDSLSNGGFKHIWIINRDGSGQNSGLRQVTGLGADAGRNQSHPTWSPDGNQIAYSDEDTSDENAGGSQLSIVNVLDANPIPSQRTFFTAENGTPARVDSPAFAPSGLSIAFVTNYDGRSRPFGDTNSRILPTRDIFTIAPDGTAGANQGDGTPNSIVRVTGDPNTDPVGNTTDDDHPAYAVNNINVLFFSSNRDQNGVLSGATQANPSDGGRRIWRILANGTGVNQVTDPTQRSNGQATDVDDYPVASPSGGFIGAGGQFKAGGESLAFQTNSFIDDSDFVDGANGRDLNIWSLPVGNATTATVMEQGRTATVVTNILSSPKNFSDSRLTPPQSVDRAADREPAFSRTVATAQTLARLVFASGRRFAPNTGSNGAATPANPFGGDQVGPNASGTVTHDIWTTSTQDTTPPALLPQGVGNLQFPVAAPQPNAPFFAPRTAEAGLRAGVTPTAADNADEASRAAFAGRGGLRFAVVLRDTESGLNETVPGTTTPTTPSSVRVQLFDADDPNFDIGRNFVDEQVSVEIARELKASAIGGSTALNVYDDGPGDGSNGSGHEQQAGAVAGDGVYFCEGLLPTPAAAGDFYIDVTVSDRQNNAFTYDNIWGISTRRFARRSVLTNLFVSDYTAGQVFPNQLSSGFDDVRFDKMPPVESYYLTNPGGQAFVSGDPGNVNFNATTQKSSEVTFANVDTWRIQCRGPVPQDVLNAFRPTIVRQIDPNNPNPAPAPTSTPAPGATATPVPTAGPSPTPTSTPQPFTQLTRPVAVSRVSIIWGSPYAGTTFVGPGTITDSTTQAALTSYLQDGGRLFISGRDIARALSFTTQGEGNSFLSDELGATFSGESPDRTFADKTAALTFEPGPGQFVFDPINGAFDTLRAPYREFPNLSPGDLNLFNDAAHIPSNITNPGPGNYLFDIITPSGAQGVEATTSYSNRGIVGQRVEHVRANGIRSRLVFFSFGFESVNRRYRQPTPNDGRIVLNIRPRMAANILEYFRTSAVSGTVTSSAGGPNGGRVPNFLLRIDGPGGPYLVRTDANGNYSVAGLSNGFYTVRPFITTRNGIPTTSPEGFFGGTPRDFFVGGGGTTTNVNLTVTPALPGGIIGRAVNSNGTFIDNVGADTSRADDTPIPNLPVLVRSVNASPAFPNSGKFARLASTNASGDFSISGVPSLAEMEVIFNPATTDIPAGSGISYSGPNPNFGRRLLPDTKRPLNTIIVPSGDNFILNDTGSVTINGTTFTVDNDSRPDTPAEERVPIIVPSGPTISGVVSVNGTPQVGATVQLFTTDANGNATSTQAVNPVQTQGSGGRTGTNGVFSFVDVSAAPRTGANSGGTRYVIRTTIVRDNLTLVRDIRITLFQGEDLTQNVDFVIATLSGRVVQGNNVAVANANVVLQNADGTTFVPSRTARTNASGNYSIPNVPVGGYTRTGNTNVFTQTSTAASTTVRYNVFASLGSLTGNSGIFSVRATDTAVTVPTIQLINQQLTGRVELQVDANPATNLSGAGVELLDGNGNSLSPRRTTTTGTDGTYSFANVAAGTYRVRATFRGDTTTSAPFTATAGAFTVPETLLIRLRTIFGTTFDSSSGRNVPTSGATVTLSQNGTVLQTLASGANGSFRFQPVAAGSGYVLRATKGTLAGTATVPTIPRASGQAIEVPVFMRTNTTGTPNPTSFDQGRTYSFSTPYATSSNAAVRNSYAFRDERFNATIALTDAFNYDPMGVNAAGRTVRFYSVSRFNPNTLAYEAVPDNGLLSRGEGYLLRVTDVPASGEKLRLATPNDNQRLVALSNGNTSTATFVVNLIYNDSLRGNGLNGRNFIGFGFDPARFGSVVWDNTSAATASTTSVQVQVGSGARMTIKQAADAGILFPSITTTDPSTGRTVITNAVTAFGGYFVQARRPGVKLIFRFPQANSN